MRCGYINVECLASLHSRGYHRLHLHALWRKEQNLHARMVARRHADAEPLHTWSGSSAWFLDRKCVKNPREFHPSLVSFLTLCDKVGYFGWRQFMLPLLRKLKLVSLFMSTAGHAPAPVAATIEAAKAAATRLPPGAPKFVLGSQSASRRAILAATGADFDAVVPDIDEKSIGDRARDAPEDLVRRIAIAKADALLAATADSHAGSVLITGDQVFK